MGLLSVREVEALGSSAKSCNIFQQGDAWQPDIMRVALKGKNILYSLGCFLGS